MPTDGILEFGDYRFDRANQILTRAGAELPLPPRALGVLSRLLEEPGSVVSKQTLLDSVWNGAYVTETSLSEAVGLLREALHDAAQEPTYIQTVHRRGYRFIAPARVVEPVSSVVGSRLSVPSGDAAQTTGNRKLITIAAVASLLVIIAIAVFARRPQPPRPPVTRFGVAPPPSHELFSKISGMAVSPDGRHLVYNTRLGDEAALAHRDLSGLASREIPGTRGAFAPFFSPDGRRVGFYRDSQLVSIPLAGGPALPLARVNGNLWGVTWSEDGSVIFASSYPSPLYRVRPGGAVERLTQGASGNGVHHSWPHALPGGKAVLFTVWTNTLWDARTEWLSLVTGERRTLLTGASDCRYASGLLVCARAGGTIGAAPFDAERGRLTGPLLPLLSDVTISATGYAYLAVGGRTLIYYPGTGEPPPRTLQRLVSGKLVPLNARPRHYRAYSEGPGGRVAATIADRGRSDVWVLDTANGESSRLTFERTNVNPVWSPDGQWVAFASKEEHGPFNLYRRRADGSGAVERLLASGRDQFPVSWSPDGRELMIVESHPETGFDLHVLDLHTRKLRPWLRTQASETDARWSPDGKWVAYMTGETGHWEVHVRSYPNGGGRWQIAPDYGEFPSWSADGRTIYVLKRPRLGTGWKLFAVPVEPRGGELSPGVATQVYAQPTMLFAAAGPGGMMLMTGEPPQQQATEVRVMLEWPSMVR